jgi:hypothetical protein
VRLNSYPSLLGNPKVTAQCARLEREGMAETCGGVIHTVDKVKNLLKLLCSFYDIFEYAVFGYVLHV